MVEDISDEEYLDDPIRLFDSEHSRVYHTELEGDSKDLDDIIEIYDSDTERKNSQLSNCEPQITLPAKFFDIDRNVELLSQCCPLSIRLIDCKNYLKKFKEKVIDMSEEVIYFDEEINNLGNEDVSKINENIENNNNNLKDTLFNDCDAKRITSKLKNNAVINENSNKDAFKDSKHFVHRLEKYARTVSNTYHKLKTLVKSPTNITNRDKNHCLNNNKIYLNTENNSEGVYLRKSDSEITNLKQRTSNTTNLMKSSNKNVYQIATPKKNISRKTMVGTKKVLENNSKEISGWYSPSLFCPHKSIDPNNEIGSDTEKSKKFNVKRIIPHYHLIPLISSNEYQSETSLRNLVYENKINSSDKIIRTSPLSNSIFPDDINISTFSNVSNNAVSMPYCLNHAFFKDTLAEVRINNEKNIKRTQTTAAEENVVKKKRILDASISGIPKETPFQVLTSCKSQVANKIERFVLSVPVQNFTLPAVDLQPRFNLNVEPQVNSYSVQNINNMRNVFTIRMDTPNVPKLRENAIKVNDYVHGQKLEAIQKVSRKPNKQQVLDKYPLLIQSIQTAPAQINASKISIENNRQASDLSNKGYSPAILPIPTFENTFNNIMKLQVSYKNSYIGKDQL